MALLSLAVAPLVFGVLGISMGAAAVTKGERYLGMLGVVAGAVFGFTGYYIAGLIGGRPKRVGRAVSPPPIFSFSEQLVPPGCSLLIPENISA